MSKTSEEEASQWLDNKLNDLVILKNVALRESIVAEVKQQIIKHFVPKEEVEAAKRETELKLTEYFLLQEGDGTKFPDDLLAVGHRVAMKWQELTNNQPNTPKGEGEV